MVLTAAQIRAWDEYTISHEPVSSLNLMERAATQCAHWLAASNYSKHKFSIFCGKGNNGGDGLALARLLTRQGIKADVYILEFGHKGTDDFQHNLEKLHDYKVNIKFMQPGTDFPPIAADDIIVDALFGSGLNRPLEGFTADLVQHLNASGNTIVAIDLPSGLFADKSSRGNTVIKARHTLTFQCYKPALLVAENEEYIGEVIVLHIGLHPGFLGQHPPAYYVINYALVSGIYKPRKRFSHKGTFGHALLVAGSEGKMGAAVLAARGCLRSGVGLLSMHIPSDGVQIMQTAVPEAMCEKDVKPDMNVHLPAGLDKYTVAGIGPGLGTHERTAHMLADFFHNYKKPVVVDADALNIISRAPHLLKQLPSHSVLTPHPKEFERLFGSTADDFARLHLAVEKAKALDVIIVLKGGHSFVATPSGKAYFNTTGNAGMATGGTGDVLTGIITGLIAQGYSPEDAAVFGVWWHGRAGDQASQRYSQESMIASDIPEALGEALKDLLQYTQPLPEPEHFDALWSGALRL